jgi:hypothetical protein
LHWIVFHTGTLPEFEVVVTLLPAYGEEIMTITDDGDLVLQQGVFTGIRLLAIRELKILPTDFAVPSG